MDGTWSGRRAAFLLNFASILLVSLCWRLPSLGAFDKNGVAPRAISLPSGPGSIQGLGESFQPQLNTGSGSYEVPLALPRGPGGQTPALALVYNSGGHSGSLGLGWSLSGELSIRRSTDHGVPLYVDAANGADDDSDGRIDNPEEIDAFTGANQEELVALADGSYRAENEGAFWRYRRAGEGWEAGAPDGRRLFFGRSPSSRVESGGKVFAWCLDLQVDRNDNTIEYEYRADPASPAQKHLRRVRWGIGDLYFAAVFNYEEGRPDVSSGYQPGFELRTSLRLSGIDVMSHGLAAPAFALRGDWDGDALPDALIRRYRLEYDAGSRLSLLSRVIQLGADGAAALPPLTLTYSRWTPLDNAAAGIIRSINAPSAGPESPSVEFIDMNGDGLPDLLSTAASTHRVSLNRGVDVNGRLAWGPSLPVGSAPPIDLSSDKTHLADANADGAADLMVKVTNTSFLCYDNTSLISWSGSPIPVRNTDTWPIWPYDGPDGRQSRSFDSDYSRTNDVLHTSESVYQLWLLLPGGRYSKEIRLAPLIHDGQVFRFDLPGTHIADLNGDRLLDLVWIQPSRVVWFPSRGRGSFAPAVVHSLGHSLTSDEIQRAGFSDVDGDGLEDLTAVRPAFQPTGVVYWLNRQERGLEGPRAVMGLPPLNNGDALRWADMNGNGTVDIVISQGQSAPGEKIAVIDLIPEGKVHLLKRVENGLGLRMDLEYESSTAQMVRAEAAGSPWTAVMPIHPTVVSRIAEDDGRGTVFDRRITYRDPFYDAVKQEFRGFQTAEAREAGDGTAEEKTSRQSFDTGVSASCLKGKRLMEEVLGAGGKVYQRSEFTWGRRTLAAGADGREVCYAFLSATDQFIQEGRDDGFHIRTESDQDDFGNITAERRLGIVDRAGDETILERTYEIRLDRWLLDLPSREITSDANGARLAEMRHEYDERGNRLRTLAWLDAGNRFFAGSSQRYDAFGNIIEYTDARGNRLEVAYDASLHVFPLLETIHLEGRDLRRSAEYDLGFGVVTRTVELSGEETTYVHDALARLVQMDRPGGAQEIYEYTFGNPVSRVVKRLRVDGSGKTFESRVYSDCYGRGLGTLVEAEGGKWRFMEGKSYNARKLVQNSWLPFLADAPDYAVPDPSLAHDETTYDAMGRTLETRKADGSRTLLEYQPLAVLVRDGNDLALGGGADVRRSDGLNRITSVEEKNGLESFLTRYIWNARGNLERVIDALGNEKNFRFDSLGRLIEVNDPDRGLWKYEYDDTGNRIRRVDSKGQAVIYQYDAANRTTRRVYSGAGAGGQDEVEAVYHYDAPQGELSFGDGTSGTARNLEGRLAWIEDRTGEEHFSYDERGNIEWSLKRLRDPSTGVVVPFWMQRAYDLLNRATEIIFPDNDRLRMQRGDGAFVSRVDGGETGAAILEEAEYYPNGRPSRMRFGNGTETLYTQDAGQRLESLKTLFSSGKELVHESLEYDPSSNITAILDLRPQAEVPADSPRRRTARFKLDELHRLIEATCGEGAGAGRLTCSYDALGNLLDQSSPPAGQAGHIADARVHLGAVSHQGGRSNRIGRLAGDPPGPHAATATASGLSFAYDANGNMTSSGGAAQTWDFENRLIGWRGGEVAAEYRHDHAGRRVARTVRRGGAREELLCPDADFEVENGAPVKYAMVDGRRLARFRGMLDPERERIQKIILAVGWNLFASAVESAATLREVLGADAAVYEAAGDSYAPVDAAQRVPAGKALWVHAPSARLALLRGRYPAAPAGGAPAGSLRAWPLLEPFRPDAHLQDPAAILVYDAAERSWLRRDPALPAFLSDAPETLGAAQAFWSGGAAAFKLAAASREAVVFYHPDHLGSPAAMTDADGNLLEERVHYPGGVLRSVHRPDGSAGTSRFDFTGKERDAESGLSVMGARIYLDATGQFLSPDPRYVEAADLADGTQAEQSSFAAFLANPQMGNPYAYAARNPIKFIDPSGLDIVFNDELMKNAAFRQALSIFAQTEEGNRILGAINRSGNKVVVDVGRPYSRELKREVMGISGGTLFQAGGKTRIRSGVLINLTMMTKALAHDKDQLIRQIAETIHHEFRHVEGNINQYTDAIAKERGMFDSANQARSKAGLSPLPVPPELRRGEEVHKALDSLKDPNEDPLNDKFLEEVEIIQNPNVRRNHPPGK